MSEAGRGWRLLWSMAGVGLGACGLACGEAGGADAPASLDGDGDVAAALLELGARDPDHSRVHADHRVARQIAPLSGSVTGSARPLLRWDGPGAVVVQLCADRKCRHPLSAFVATRNSARPARALPPGVTYWRLLSLGRGRAIRATATWELFVPGGHGASATANRGLRYDADADGFVDAAVRAQNANAVTDVLQVFPGGRHGLDAKRDIALTLDTTYFGISMAAAGDVNGDGFGDVAVADGRGVVVYAGSATGPRATPLSVIPAPPGVNGFSFGFGLSGLGDVNGDGYGDVVVADGFVLIWVFTGGPSGLSSTPAWVLDRRDSGDRFARLMTAGDLDGDGFGDLVITDYGPDGTPQGFRFFRGSAAGLEAPGAGTFVERLAFPTGTAGDVDGDGIMDLVTAEEATLALFRGGPGFPPAAPAQVVPIAARPGSLQLGDFDGDGAFDLAATTSTPTSDIFFTDDRIDIYPGGSAGLALAPAQTLIETAVLPDNQLNFGTRLRNGDFDRDRREDLLVGAPPPFPTPFFDTSASVVFVFAGAAGGVGPTPATRLDGTPGFGDMVSAGVPQSGP